MTELNLRQDIVEVCRRLYARNMLAGLSIENKLDEIRVWFGQSAVGDKALK